MKRTRKTRRNPKTKIPVIPLALAAGGIYLLMRNRQTAPVDGMGDLGRSLRSVGRSISNAVSSAGSSVARVVKQVSAPVQTVAKTALLTAAAAPQVFKATLPITALLPGSALLTAGAALMSRGGGAQEEAAQAAPEVQYQDENGNVITEAEYNRRVAEAAAAEKAAAEAAKEPVYQDANGNTITKAQYDQLLAALKAQGASAQPTTEKTSTGATVMKLPPMPPVVPQPNVKYFDADGQPITESQFSAQMNALPGSNPHRVSIPGGWAYRVPAAQPVASSGGVLTPPPVTYQPSGGSASSDYSLPPAYTPPTQAAAPAYSTEAAPAAPSKVNPALAVGTMAAIPLLFMLGAK